MESVVGTPNLPLQAYHDAFDMSRAESRGLSELQLRFAEQYQRTYPAEATRDIFAVVPSIAMAPLRTWKQELTGTNRRRASKDCSAEDRADGRRDRTDAETLPPPNPARDQRAR